MKKPEWSDEQLEQMLTHMPAIKDNRKPQEIYQNISLKTNKKKKKVWIVPTFASAAAVILLFILAPSFINNMNTSSSDSAEMARENTSMAMDTENKEAAPEEDSIGTLQKAEEGNKDSEARLFSFADQQSYTIKKVEKNEVLLTYGVYLGGAQFPSVISVVVESDGENIVEQWEKNVPLVNDIIQRNPGWGIDPISTSYFADFSEIVTSDGAKAVKVDVADNVNTESFATGQLNEFTQTINSFRYLMEDYQHAELFQNNKQGIMIGQTGLVENNIDIEKDTKKAYLYYMNEESDLTILTPSIEDYNTVEQAIEAMKEQANQGDYPLHPTINSEVNKVHVNGNNLEIYFSDNAILENTDPFIRMVEAIMLTAKEFNFETVTFHGNIDQIGDVPFGEPVKVPLAPNPLPLH